MGILPGIHLVHKKGAEPAAFIVLGIEAAGQKNSGGHTRVGEPQTFHLFSPALLPQAGDPHFWEWGHRIPWQL